LLLPFLRHKQIDAIFFYLFDDYSGLHGEIFWENEKPVIGGRYNLWQTYETPRSLAGAIEVAI
jgi:hypothetical protein